MPEMTERQAKAWPDAIAELNRAAETHAVREDQRNHCWSLTWEDEIRPGRGHTLDAIWCDGEYFAQIRMDVYGSFTTSIATLDWIHIPSEECSCVSCEAEREGDD